MTKIAVIPIRSGSERFKNKNIYNINGYPLFYFAAYIANKCGIFDKVVIASDSQEYLDIAKKFNLEVFLRSKESSKPQSQSEQVLLEVSEFYNLKNEDWVFLVQATSPLQQEKYFYAAEKMLCNYDSVVTIEKSKRFTLDYITKRKRLMSQDFAATIYEVGLFWGTRCSVLRKNFNRLGGKIGTVEVKTCDCLDVDYFEDLEKYIPYLKLISNNFMK